MIQQTFCHLRGITVEKERALWKSGITSWDELESSLQPQFSLFGGLSSNSSIVREIHLSREALAQRNVAFFASRLPRSEIYRLAHVFPESVLFLDIETTGLSRYYDYITLVGLSSGANYYVYIRGGDGRELIERIQSAQIVVTFNGALFDIPFVNKEFSGIAVPSVHIDLRFLSRRAGLSGGQKDLEERLSIKRPIDVSDLRGDAAPILWHRYRRGDLSSLEKLVLYNSADISGMKGIFDSVTARLMRKMPSSLKASVWRFSKDEVFSAAQNVIDSFKISPPPAGPPARSLITNNLVFTDRVPQLRVVGIDITGSEKRPSGWCYLDGKQVTTRVVRTDEELFKHTVSTRPHLVSIDSPLSLPPGRKLDRQGHVEPVEGGEIMRYCERLLKKRGVNVYPALIQSMTQLTARGIRLASMFRKEGIPTIESYPGAAQDIMNIPRKRAGLDFLRAGLAEFGLAGKFLDGGASHDELDAITSAIVGAFFWSGKFERLGEDATGDEALVIPDLDVDPIPWRDGVVIGLSGPLAAGKTTSARLLESMGLGYGRYSMVLEANLRLTGRETSRKALQDYGKRINRTRGQRWLGRELLKLVSGPGGMVIDGLRFPEDHAFLGECFGPGFVHVHIAAPKAARRRRYIARGGSGREFNLADSHDVEASVGSMEGLAQLVYNNDGTEHDFLSGIRKLINSTEALPCRFQWLPGDSSDQKAKARSPISSRRKRMRVTRSG